MRRTAALWRALALVVVSTFTVSVAGANPAAADPWLVLDSLEISGNTSLCLTTSGVANGAPVYLGACPSVGQTWDINGLDNGHFEIRRRGSNRCLTAPAWNNYYALLYDCHQYADQLWDIEYLYGTYYYDVAFMAKFVNVNRSDKCLIGPNWSSGRALAYTCAVHSDQNWGVYGHTD